MQGDVITYEYACGGEEEVGGERSAMRVWVRAQIMMFNTRSFI